MDLHRPRPLELGEIISNVLGHLRADGRMDSRSLLSCTQVNSHWFTAAAKYLWAERPSVRGFAIASRNHGRCQFYADIVKILKLKDWGRKPEVLSRLKFPRLEELDIAQCEGDDETQSLVRILRPKVRTLRYHNAETKDFLTLAPYLQVRQNAFGFACYYKSSSNVHRLLPVIRPRQHYHAYVAKPRRLPWCSLAHKFFFITLFGESLSPSVISY